jgi:hypothetical protein
MANVDAAAHPPSPSPPITTAAMHTDAPYAASVAPTRLQLQRTYPWRNDTDGSDEGGGGSRGLSLVAFY